MKIVSSLKNAIKRLVAVFTSIRYQYCVKRLNINVHNSHDTVEKILKDKVSVARFGDGEFYLMWMTTHSPFQRLDPKLSERLKEVFKADDKNLIVCVSYYLRKINPDLIDKIQRWARDWVVRYYRPLKQTFDEVPDKEFYDTNFTRFYVSHKDKAASRLHIELIKQIWAGRDVCIVEGASTRMGVGNDLFAEAKSVTRILCPPTSAFDKYDEILETTLRLVPKDTLVLSALGMTATVLAYDLCKAGYQAIDLGHLDIEYEWLLMGATEKTAIKNKAVNEVGVRIVEDTVKDADYLNSIIAKVGVND